MESKASSDLNKAILEELVKGRDYAKQLLELVHHRGSNNIGDYEGSLIIPFAQGLVNSILGSFTDTLLLINYDFDSHEISISDCPKSEEQDDLDERCKTSSSTRNRRGCYKRKRNVETWEKESPILVDDGYAWRKYGQKMTMNTEYLRNYYRCSHKEDQGCPAMKQVQRIREKPPLYRTTYFGHHTCKIQMLSETQMTLDSSFPSDSSLLLSFNNTLPNKQDHPFFSSSTTKKEHIKEEIPNDHHVKVEQNQMSQYEHITALSSTLDLFDSLEADDNVLLRCLDLDDFVRFGLRERSGEDMSSRFWD